MNTKEDPDDFFDSETAENFHNTQPFNSYVKRGVHDPTPRANWATAALAALAYAAVLGALFVALRGLWPHFPSIVRVATLLLVLTGTYAVGWYGSRIGNAQLGKLFAIFGALFYGLTLALLSKNAPSDFTTHAGWIRLAARSFPAVAPFWALGAFALAAAYRSRLLHYFAVLIVLFWLSTDSSGLDGPLAIVFCGVGEYWAWRRKSASVGALYFALCAWILLTERSLWKQGEALALVAVAVAVLLYWFGANFNNAIVRGFALLLAACALGYASFPLYWQTTLNERVIERLGEAWAVHLPAMISSLFFIAFCINTTLGGAQHSATRFAFGIAATACWTVGQAFNMHNAFGALGAVCVLLIVAAAFVMLIVWNKRLQDKYAREGRSIRRDRSIRRVTTDGANDSPEFDDVFDREARKARTAVPSMALAYAYEKFLARSAAKLGRPLTIAAIVLQYVLLAVNLIWRLR